MARKKAAAPAAPAPENTAPAPEVQEAPESKAALQEQEAHLAPEQLKSMDDDNLRGLAQDLGLDPAAYESREALLSAIAEVPVIPGPPEDPEPEQPEAVPDQEAPAPAPEQKQEDPDPEPDPAGGRRTPYKATVAVSLAVLHKAVGLGTEDMLKPVGTLRQGAEVTVMGRKGTYAQLRNGLYILEAFLEVRPIS